MAGADVIAQQTALYGEPLADRFARMLATYRIPQSRLAQVIGLSAPMLSQLASGQRVKISNPAVYARLLRLEETASSPAVRSGDPMQLNAALDEVAASRPQLTTEHASTTAETALEHLSRIAGPQDLARAAAAVPATALAELLLGAAERAPNAQDSSRPVTAG